MSRWREARISADSTHHELAGRPLYDRRFDEVLSFHEPGLAAVQRENEGWHIDPRGEPAYGRRFRRTFGFYGGFAAVIDASGWGYITADGRPACDARFAWCGNLQDDRMAVRDLRGDYLHLTRELRPAYPERWRYAGDFRHGIAVVQGDHGQATHIDREGRPVHGRWFADLDVFHKGFARARDAGGWMHVDRRGEPLYGRRFAAVEPFYNGQARVERIDGALEIIDERGETVHTLRGPTEDAFAALSRELVGSWRTDTIATAVTLGIFDALPGTAAELAGVGGVPEGSARRLLGGLGELGLVEEAQGRWRAQPRGEFLSSRHPLSLAGAALEYAGPLRRRWARLVAALRGAAPPDVFEEASRDSKRLRRLSQMLTAYADHDYPEVAARLPIVRGDRVIDAGGGSGALARRLLARDPEVSVVILERPEVAAQIALEPGGRLRAEAADLWAPWPVQGELIVLARVLHDWDDARALTLLTHARQALAPGGRLAIVELLRDERGFGGSLCDLHLLAVTGGAERTLAEYRRLLEAAGFMPPQHLAVPALPQILVAEPA